MSISFRPGNPLLVHISFCPRLTPMSRSGRSVTVEKSAFSSLEFHHFSVKPFRQRRVRAKNMLPKGRVLMATSFLTPHFIVYLNPIATRFAM